MKSARISPGLLLAGLLALATPALAAPPGLAPNPELQTSGGVGLVLNLTNGQLKVQRVIPHTPAARAGLAEGDSVIAVDGRAVKGMKLKPAVALLRGKPATEVKLTVIRQATGREETLTLTRTRLEDLMKSLQQNPVIYSAGLRLRAEGLKYFVREVIDGSPAAGAGIVPGDELLKIDGIGLDGRTPPMVEGMLNGPLNTPVSLVVKNQKDGKERDLVLKRTVNLTALDQAQPSQP